MKTKRIEYKFDNWVYEGPKKYAPKWVFHKSNKEIRSYFDEHRKQYREYWFQTKLPELFDKSEYEPTEEQYYKHDC